MHRESQSALTKRNSRSRAPHRTFDVFGIPVVDGSDATLIEYDLVDWLVAGFGETTEFGYRDWGSTLAVRLELRLGVEIGVKQMSIVKYEIWIDGRMYWDQKSRSDIAGSEEWRAAICLPG